MKYGTRVSGDRVISDQEIGNQVIGRLENDVFELPSEIVSEVRSER